MTKHVSNTSMLPPSNVAFILDPTKPVLSHGRDMLAETSIERHTHPRGQLLWAEQGVLRVSGDDAVWVVPSTHAIWIPGNISHQVSSETHTKIRNIYIDPSYIVRKKDKNTVMVVMSSLMQEIILRLTDDTKILAESNTKRLGLVAIDELEELESSNLYIHSGQDPRLQRLVSHIVQHSQDTFSLTELSTLVGASVRTIERLFKAETGMTFRQWRSRFKLMNALSQLSEGKSSTAVAHHLGYKSVSSFINTFKSEFGCTPQQYVVRR